MYSPIVFTNYQQQRNRAFLPCLKMAKRKAVADALYRRNKQNVGW